MTPEVKKALDLALTALNSFPHRHLTPFIVGARKYVSKVFEQASAAQPARVDEGLVSTWLEMGAPETFKNVTVKEMLIALQYFSPPAQPAHVQQEPVAFVSGYYGGQCVVLPTNPATLFNSGTAFYTAPQPVPVKTYHDGKPWPVQPKPWVGLTDEERNECTQSPFTADQHRAIEAKLKEKNHDQ
jgi:hypothetical protein